MGARLGLSSLFQLRLPVMGLAIGVRDRVVGTREIVFASQLAKVGCA